MWNDLTMQQRADVISMAVKAGIKDMNSIRSFYDKSVGPSREYKKGGYLDWKEKASKYKHLDIDNDKTYDYEGWYNENPQRAWDFLNDSPNAHFDDKYKTVYHPTFSTQSKYSGIIDSKFNPQGLVGGTWSKDNHIFTMSPDGYRGPVSMDERKWYLENAEDNGVQLREANGSLPIYDNIPWGGVLPNVTIMPRRFGDGGHLYDGGGRKNTPRMQIGRGYWESQANKPTLEEELAEYRRQKALKVQKAIETLKSKEFKDSVEKTINKKTRANSTTSNDAIFNTTVSKNSHLGVRGEEGAKAHAAWEKEHPNLTAWGNVAGAIPFAVASVPVLAAAGEAAAPVLMNPYLDAAFTSLGAAHGAQSLANGNANWMTALELLPAARVAKPIYEGAIEPGMRLFNSPLTGNWTKIGNREYRLSPNSLGANGSPIESRGIAPQITAENAASVTPEQWTPEQWTAAQDAAIARGDMAEAQRLRDLHFKVSAPNTKTDVPLWTSSEDAFNSFDLSHFGETDSGFFGYGHYLTPIEKYAATYHPINRKFYANIENPYIGSNDQYFNRIQYVKDRLAKRKENVMRNLRDGKLTKFSKKLGINENTSLEDAERLVDKYIADETVKWNDKYVKYADEFKGKDGVLSWRELQGIPNKQEGIYREVVVPRGEQIKSADAITYDDNGVRIPLGERDNFNINDIRYGLLPFLGLGAAAYGLNSEETSYKEGGSIHIAPSKRGTFTAAATKHGMGVQEFASKVLAHPENYSLTMRKKANFARNASKWKH